MNHKLHKTIQQILLAGAGAAFAAGTFAAAGIQIPPPGPGAQPDYFGVTPNYANSPQPVLATVTVAAPASGTQATAAVTVYDYANGTYTPPGAVAGTVNTGIKDVQVVNPGSGYNPTIPPTTANGGITVTGGTGAAGAAVTANVNGIIGVTLHTGGNGYIAIPNVTISAPDQTGGTQATATATIANGAVTDIIFTNVGSGYTVAPTITIDPPTGLAQTVPATAGATVSASNNPFGMITGITLVGGNGYIVPNPQVLIDPPPVTCPGTVASPCVQATATATVVGGVVTAINLTNPGKGYDSASPPAISIAAPTGTPALLTATILLTKVNATPGTITGFTVTDPGTGYTTPVNGFGLRKFVDTVPLLNTANNLGQQLPVAVPDQTTYPGSDYYVIGEVEYQQQMHSDLPATQLRGYVQLIETAGSNGPTYTQVGTPQYLGPVIVAQQNRPVRAKVVNLLSKSGDGSKLQGALPFPVDKTYMGAANTAASPSNTDNRTSVHLHGGNTPWISDGTPRQWFKPKGEGNPNKGVSSSNVPDMWFDANGNLLSTCQGTTTCATPGATNNPGDGASTFFFTNQQSQRLMFYHDHAEGTTRLNVYGGMAAGYVLQDPTEQAMITGGSVTVTDPVTGASNFVNYNQVLPPIEDTIPLVIQEKTFVPDDTTPVLNFFGAFKSQLNSQDPTWNWGVNYGTTPTVTTKDSQGKTLTTTTEGTGDLWVPHVYMTNQNPGDTTGANSLGRWDYGPWFWPPATGLVNGPAVNAYYDTTCVSSAANICESQYVPGMPGNISATPEAFNDTPVVNGTAYPYMTIDPKKYRLRLLSVGNDRMLNLSLVVAASKKSPDTSAAGNAAPANNTILCDGSDATINQADCTEVKMVPFNDAQNTASAFPAWWYTYQKGGVTFDGRPSGVFDPATRGPAMVQIGTEGGFLSTPAVIRNQPVNFEYNLKNIVVTNVKEHALLLGPAERADVVVDFSKFAGSTILLYNDSPAPVPAFDLRLDYFTGNPDNTDTGGAFSTVPGYGPNTRTIMQFRVRSACTTTNCGTTATGINRDPVVAASTHQDDVDPAMVVANNQAAYGANTATGGALVAAVQQAFKYSQDPVIVPQAAYNRVYGTSVADAMSGNISKISDTALTFKPLADSFTGALEATAVTLGQGPKGIQELFTMDYGRMNALLSTEIPNTSATIQTTIPYYYVDAPTELVKISPNNGSPVVGPVGVDPVNSQMDDGTQLWKITHNGVDTHAVHFHLFNVQIINRVGWDGMVRNTELNELGWKDTVRMSPLEDVIVALRPKKMLDSTDLHALYPTEANITGMDFQVPNSHRLLDPSQGPGPDANFYQLDPLTGNASTESNQMMNFGWEYVWHCHILGHEENDMMRTISVAQQPDAPALTALTGAGVAVANNGSANGPINVNWNDNSMVANWVTIQRDTTTLFNSANLATFNVVELECNSQAGCPRTFIDATPPASTNVYYRVKSHNTVGAGDAYARLPAGLATTTNGLLPVGTDGVPGFLGFDNVTADSAWASSATVGSRLVPISPGALAFGNVQLNTPLAPQTVTVSNPSNSVQATVSVQVCSNSSVNATCNSTASSAMYTLTSNTCTGSLAPKANCTFGVTFNPTTTGAKAGYVKVITGGTTFSNVALTGTGVNPSATVSTPLAFGLVQVGTTSAQLASTVTNTGSGPLTLGAITLGGNNPANYAIAPASCFAGQVLPVAGTCPINVNFKPTVPVGAENANISVSFLNNLPAAKTVSLTGTAVQPVPALTGTAAFGNVNGTKKITYTLTNGGGANSAPLILTGITVPYAPVAATGSYAIDSGGTCAVGNTIAANGGTCTVIVAFVSASTNNATTATLTVTGTGVGTGAPTYTATRALTGS